MSTSVPGRPRLAQKRRPGTTPRDEVLDAAGELFTTRGYAATSTRKIAEAVGMRQPSLYHHFRTKDDILEALLSGTVAGPLRIADALARRPLSAPVRLHALCHGDAVQLWTSPWNLGILYLLPEVRTERFARFHQQRDALRLRYRALSQAVLDEAPAPPTGGYRADPADDTVFRLTETLPNLRADGLGHPDQPLRTADLALHTLGWPDNPATLHAPSAQALEQATSDATPPTD
ncbi:TetR/AcrR family transcriptional regulator [Streptomyces sp. NBRC 109706]|uniref:TetR/AcrR family transcriptional regulator n=1 Tax=Streptomyces sp. NBRC 109706 TaxID=1550035 RepID=UPI000784E189|nr:TetR/AcrR family transcriptional regulator [Streptomyces sp. NBRC 109706]